MSAPELDEIASELEALSERLVDAAMDRLRRALEDGSPESAEAARAADKLLNRARAATERASSLVRRAAGASGDGRFLDEEP